MKKFQHTAARRRLVVLFFLGSYLPFCFNTQPPEGGWRHRRDSARVRDRFNTQPPEGGWAIGAIPRVCETVSTHSRPKAAGQTLLNGVSAAVVSTHSRPKAAGAIGAIPRVCETVSTHSRPKAAGIF